MTTSLPDPGPLVRARAYLGRAASIGVAMARFAKLGRKDGVENGVRAFRALGREIGGALRGREGDRVCTLCGWTGERFGPIYYVDNYREDTLCYACGSTDRVRLLPLFCRDALGGFFGEKRRRVLDIGPLSNSRRFFPDDVDYVSFDLYAKHAMVRGDLVAAPFADDTFDLWVCFHVLDLIEDDERAMRELYRILAPGGIGLLDNAMNWNAPTEEYGRVRPEDSLHRRRYGHDLPDRLRKLGFEIEIVDVERTFDEATRTRYGIHPRKFLMCKKPRREDADQTRT
ncbi:class I SAM-dependent methyltransferase [Polyangium sp. 15x6]|uniref:class I SAM-dependent methyltransferase n=1 Tax=Polyangium sp. 15x6 TaxID=3042687 RepID=UPI00249C0B6C|nr:class I SAM-dependent methyltransferase [Polyangium sp. 15x6]MDI3286248.1 methyltransferase domain-containing protein [Polyangium sp. 15x6]